MFQEQEVQGGSTHRQGQGIIRPCHRNWTDQDHELETSVGDEMPRRIRRRIATRPVRIQLKLVKKGAPGPV